ncbi:MAG: hypothetical protein JW772_04940 [Candidatus Diapherotrites archaeon]|nr:hypothetical protein [Candidatus Diapherotrites archaeon]
MKRIFFAFLIVLLLAGTASALNISAPEQVPSNVNWSFWVEFTNTDFSEARVMLNGGQIAVLHAYGSQVNVAENSIDHVNAISVTASGNRAFFSMAGTGIGEHSLSIDAYRNSEIIDSGVANVSVFDSLGADYKGEIEERLESLKASIIRLTSESNDAKTLLEELKNSSSSTQQSLEQKASDLGSRIDQLNSGLDNLISQFSNLETDVLDLQEEEFKEEQQELFDEQAGLFGKEKMQEPQKGIFDLTGFLYLGNTALIYGLAIIVVIVVIFGAVKFSGKKGFAVWKPKIRKEKSNLYDEKSDLGSALKESISEERAGKWAFEEGEEQSKREQQEQKRFSLGDLLPRNK